MWTTILILACAVIVARGAWSGYRGGGMARLVTLGALAVAYLGAGLLVLNRVELPQLAFIPRLLQPFVLGGAAGAVLFLTATLLGRRSLRRWEQSLVERARAAGDEAPAKHSLSSAAWNRRLGLAIGSLEGAVFAGMLFFSVHYLSLWTIASGPPAAAPVTAVAGTEPRPPKLLPAVALSPDPSPLHAALRSMGDEIRRSPVGRAADWVAPVKARHVEMAGALTQLASDERNLKRFAENEGVKRLMHHPPLVRLANDEGIQKALKEQRWADLMNDPQILALARDETLLREIRNIDLEKLLGEVGGLQGLAGDPPAPEQPVPPVEERASR